jgi:hypothetical protein
MGNHRTFHKASAGRLPSVAGDAGAEPSDWDDVPDRYVLLMLGRAAVALGHVFQGRYKSMPVSAALMRYRLLLDI